MGIIAEKEDKFDLSKGKIKWAVLMTDLSNPLIMAISTLSLLVSTASRFSQPRP
jgi:hypothetical protein